MTQTEIILTNFEEVRRRSIILWEGHDLAIDNSGNIYAGDILGNRIQKFRKIPDDN